MNFGDTIVVLIGLFFIMLLYLLLQTKVTSHSFLI